MARSFRRDILDSFWPQLFRANLLEMLYYLANADAGVQLALHPQQKLNVAFGLEAVAIGHAYRR